MPTNIFSLHMKYIQIQQELRALTFSPSSFIAFSMSVKFIPSTPLITGTTNPFDDKEERMRTQMNQNQLYTHVQKYFFFLSLLFFSHTEY